jgi:hypothetical protein
MSSYFWDSAAKETVFYDELQKQELAAFSDQDRQGRSGQDGRHGGPGQGKCWMTRNNWFHVKQSETVTL